MSFIARDLAIKLSAGIDGTERINALWAMACPGCDSTGEKPACQNSQPPCPSPSNDAEAWTRAFPGDLALLRREMKNAVGRA